MFSSKQIASVPQEPQKDLGFIAIYQGIKLHGQEVAHILKRLAPQWKFALPKLTEAIQLFNTTTEKWTDPSTADFHDSRKTFIKEAKECVAELNKLVGILSENEISTNQIGNAIVIVLKKFTVVCRLFDSLKLHAPMARLLPFFVDELTAILSDPLTDDLLETMGFVQKSKKQFSQEDLQRIEEQLSPKKQREKTIETWGKAKEKIDELIQFQINAEKKQLESNPKNRDKIEKIIRLLTVLQGRIPGSPSFQSLLDSMATLSKSGTLQSKKWKDKLKNILPEIEFYYSKTEAQIVADKMKLEAQYHYIKNVKLIEPPPKEETTQQKNKDIIEVLEEQIKEMYDEDVRKEYFTQKKPHAKNMPPVQRAGNYFIEIKEAIIKHRTRKKDTASNVIETTLLSKNIIGATRRFLEIENQLQDFPLLKQLKTEKRALIPPKEKELKNENPAKSIVITVKQIIHNRLDHNAFLQLITSDEVKKICKELKNSTDQLQTLQQKLNKSSIDKSIPQLIEDVEKVRPDAIILTDELDPTTTFDTLVFSAKHLLTGLKALKDLSGSYKYLSKTAKRQFEQSAQAINLALRDIFVELDQIEIERCLKEGYFTNLPIRANHSLRSLATAFHDIMKSINYNFSREEQFPYACVLLRQRKHMLQKHPDGTFANKFIKKRIDSMIEIQQKEEEKPENELATKRKEHTDSLKSEVSKLIDARIAELTGKNKKEAQVLTEIKGTLGDHARLDDQLNEIGRKEKMRGYFYLIYKGKSGDMLRKLKHKGSTKEQLQMQVDAKLSVLTRKQTETFYFFTKLRKTKIQEKIQGLMDLKFFLNKPGCTIESAMKDLKEKNKAIFHVIVKEEQKLIRDMRAIYEDIPNFERGKKIIQHYNNNPSTEDRDMPPYVVNLINEQINKLKPKDTVRRQLLADLKLSLRKMPLDDAINYIKDKSIVGEHFYLLYEAPLKEFLNNIRLALSSRDSIIDFEILKLQENRGKRFYFFAKHQTDTFEKCIQALLAVKEGKITAFDEEILNQYDTTLLQNLHAWDQIHFNPSFTQTSKAVATIK